MDKLILKQSNITEKVTTDIIESIYNIVSNTPPPLLSDLRGNLTVSHAYDDSVTYLNTNYPNLIINVTDGKYIRFADKEVEKICAANWGDGIGITVAQAASVSSVGIKFIYNENIISFEEFKYFTNVTYLQGSNSSANPGAFNGCTSLKKIILPSSITDIQQGSFYNCAITYINLENIKTIGPSCFTYCPLNMELSIPNLTGSFSGFAGTNITKIIDLGKATSIVGSGDYYHTYGAALGSCHYLTEVILPDTMTSITGMIDCTALEKVSFNNNVTIIGDSTFQGCTKLTSIGDVSNVTSIGDSAFYNCTKLTSIGNLTNITSIGSSSFNRCSSLKSFDIGKIIKIPNSAFSGCTSLETIDLTNVTYIGGEAFYNCSSLKNIGSLEKITYIGNYSTFGNCSSLVIDLNLPNLEYFAGSFNGSGITNIVNLGKIKIIEWTASFTSCLNLKTAILPDTLTEIASNLFAYNTNIKWVKCLAVNVPKLDNNSAFISSNIQYPIYVPDDSVSAYKTATNWSTYASRIFSLTQFATDFPNG